MESERGPGRRIGAADTTFEIIELLDRRTGVRLSEIADEVDLSESTVHTYLATMKHHGFVVQEDRKYRLSFRFLEVGGARRQQMESLSLVRQSLDSLVEQPDEIAWFITEEDGYGVFLEKATGEDAVQPCSHVGKRRHLHCIAGGKAILSQLDRQEVTRIIERRGLPSRTGATITDESELLDQLGTIDDRGYALNHGENIDGWRAVASPVTFEGTVRGAIAVSGPKHRIEGDRFERELPERVKAASTEIQLELRSATVASGEE